MQECDKEEITLCVSSGSLYALLLISEQQKASSSPAVPKPQSRPVSLAVMLTQFSPLLCSLLNFGCHEADRVTLNGELFKTATV